MSYPGRSPRCFSRAKLGLWKRRLNTEEKSAEGIVGGATAEGPNDERRKIMKTRNGNASDHLHPQAVATPQDELVAGSSGQPESIQTQALFTVPGKPSDDVAPGTLNSIMKQSGLKK